MPTFVSLFFKKMQTEIVITLLANCSQNFDN